MVFIFGAEGFAVKQAQKGVQNREMYPEQPKQTPQNSQERQRGKTSTTRTVVGVSPEELGRHASKVFEWTMQEPQFDGLMLDKKKNIRAELIKGGEGHELHVHVPLEQGQHDKTHSDIVAKALLEHDLPEGLMHDESRDHRVHFDEKKMTLKLIVPVKLSEEKQPASKVNLQATPAESKASSNASLDYVFPSDVSLLLYHQEEFSGKEAQAINARMRRAVQIDPNCQEILAITVAKEKDPVQLEKAMGLGNYTLNVMAYELHVQLEAQRTGKSEDAIRKEELGGNAPTSDTVKSMKKTELFQTIRKESAGIPSSKAVSIGQMVPDRMAELTINQIKEEKKYSETLISLIKNWRVMGLVTQFADSAVKLFDDLAKSTDFFDKTRKDHLKGAKKALEIAPLGPAEKRLHDLYILLSNDKGSIETLDDDSKKFYMKNAPALLAYISYVQAVVSNKESFGGEKTVNLALMVGELIGRDVKDVPPKKLSAIKQEADKLYGAEKTGKVSQILENSTKLHMITQEVISRDPESYIIFGPKGEIAKDEKGDPVPNIMKISLAVAKEIEELSK
jgi:hypothetical protein